MFKALLAALVATHARRTLEPRLQRQLFQAFQHAQARPAAYLHHSHHELLAAPTLVSLSMHLRRAWLNWTSVNSPVCVYSAGACAKAKAWCFFW